MNTYVIGAEDGDSEFFVVAKTHKEAIRLWKQHNEEWWDIPPEPAFVYRVSLDTNKPHVVPWNSHEVEHISKCLW